MTAELLRLAADKAKRGANELRDNPMTFEDIESIMRALAAWLREHSLSGYPGHEALAVARAVLGEADSGEGRGGAVSEGEA